MAMQITSLGDPWDAMLLTFITLLIGAIAAWVEQRRR